MILHSNEYHVRTSHRIRPTGARELFTGSHQKLQQQKHKTARITFHQKLHSRLQELDQQRVNLVQTQEEKNHMEIEIVKEVKGPQYVDAKLLDGSVVRMETHQYLVHLSNEIERVTKRIVDLEREIYAMQHYDPVVHHAASSIQTQYHTYRKRMAYHKQVQANVRRLLSAEQCYERMNALLHAREKKQWEHAAQVIISSFRIMVAKRVLQRHRENRAATKIATMFRQRCLRKQGHTRVVWYKTKRRALEWKHRRILDTHWRFWRLHVSREKVRHARIVEYLKRGHTKWLTSIARRLQHSFHCMMETHAQLRSLPLHPILRHTVTTIASKYADQDKREIFRQAYQEIMQDLYTWRDATSNMYTLSQRYELQLEPFSIEHVWTWLLSQQTTSYGVV